MGFMWWGVGLSLLVAVGTLILNMKTRPLEYEDKSEPEVRSSRRRSRDRALEKDHCVICLTEIEPKNKEFLPCFHFFHSHCIRNLRQYAKKCPVCRTQF